MNLWLETRPPLRFYGVCLITDDVPRLRAFYEALFGNEGEGDDTHVDLNPAGANLGIFAGREMEAMAPGSMAGAGAGNAVVGVHVEGDAAIIDTFHARLLALGVPVVKPPQTHPWGSRSVWFRDPDGNVVTLAAEDRG